MTQFTGHLSLLVDVCTNFVHKDVEGLSGYALGGSNCTARSIQPERNIFVVLNRTSMIYGGAGLRYGTYVEFGRDFRSYDGGCLATHRLVHIDDSPEPIVLVVHRNRLSS